MTLVAVTGLSFYAEPQHHHKVAETRVPVASGVRGGPHRAN
jgi:hypothetical protein